MSLCSDWRTLYAMLLAPITGDTHAERLESFYARQAEGYDAFRQRLLHGRRELWTMLPLPDGGVWLDLGGGTAANLEYVGTAIQRLAHIYVVDLSRALLGVAQGRVRARKWRNVVTVHDDVRCFVPPDAPVDLVTFSYALTMIPDWFAAIDHAWRLLKPGGYIGVVDFYVSRKHPEPGQVRHTWLTRTFWPIWFGTDNVYPSPDHVPYLHHRFEAQHFSAHRGTMPYMPGARVPYYVFVGRKLARSEDAAAGGGI